MTTLPSDHEIAAMHRALVLAQGAADAGEVPIGAVLLDDAGKVIADGANQPIGFHDPTAHAEIVALRAASQKFGNYRLPGTTMVVTVEPCLMCLGALMNARVSRLVYGCDEPKWGAVRSQIKIEDLRVNHRIEIVSGLEADRCSALLVDFFRTRRLATSKTVS